jgi:uncharacterized transporter YbjL
VADTSEPVRHEDQGPRDPARFWYVPLAVGVVIGAVVGPIARWLDLDGPPVLGLGLIAGIIGALIAGSVMRAMRDRG